MHLCVYCFDFTDCSETLSMLRRFDDIFVKEPGKPGAHEREIEKLVPLRFCPPIAESALADEPWRDSLRMLLETNQEPSSREGGATTSPPVDGLTLDWVYGRNAMTQAVYCSNGDVIHAAGSTVIMTKKGEAAQEYFMGHLGHVTSIDIFEVDNSVGDVVATADAGSESKICVWTSNTLSLVVAISSFHSSGISKLNFSKSGELLLALDNDGPHSVAVYKWRSKQIVFTTKVPGTEMYDCSFLASDNSFGVCANEAVYFWSRLKPNTPYVRHRGVFNRLSTREVMTSISCAGGTVITGSLSGRLWIWEGRVCTRLLADRLSGPITQLHAPRKGTGGGLCASTYGGSIHLFNSGLGTSQRLVPNKGFSDSERVTDTVCWHPNFGVLVGQNGNLLYQMSVCDENNVTPIVKGHCDISGVTLHNANIITVGKNKIKEWDATNTTGRLVPGRLD